MRYKKVNQQKEGLPLPLYRLAGGRAHAAGFLTKENNWKIVYELEVKN